MRRKQWQCLIALLCLGIVVTSAASRREELERAAELAVERAAERAAERAVERALDSGNTTTESKLVRESYSNTRKENPREGIQQEDENDSEPGEYAKPEKEEKKEEEEEEEEDADDWSRYIRGSRFRPHGLSGFREWSSQLDFRDIWKRFPRSEWSHEDISPESKPRTKVGKRMPTTVTVERKIPYSLRKHVIGAPITQPYALEKRAPVKVYVPVKVPESYQAERQVPCEVRVDKIEVPVSRPYAIDKPVSYEVRVPAPYPLERKLPVKVTVNRPYSVSTPKPYPVAKPYPVKLREMAEKPYRVPNPQLNTEKSIEATRPYSVANKPYQRTKPVLIPMKKPVSYVIQDVDWKDQGNVSEDKDDLTENERRRAR